MPKRRTSKNRLPSEVVESLCKHLDRTLTLLNLDDEPDLVPVLQSYLENDINTDWTDSERTFLNETAEFDSTKSKVDKLKERAIRDPDPSSAEHQTAQRLLLVAETHLAELKRPALSPVIKAKQLLNANLYDHWTLWAQKKIASLSELADELSNAAIPLRFISDAVHILNRTSSHYSELIDDINRKIVFISRSRANLLYDLANHSDSKLVHKGLNQFREIFVRFAKSTIRDHKSFKSLVERDRAMLTEIYNELLR